MSEVEDIRSGYEPRRVDQKHHHLNKVDDEIIAEIRRSRFLVADFTCEPDKVRGGVYFETGFAMGLNIPIIWTCKDTSMKDLHFDTRQFPHIVWTLGRPVQAAQSPNRRPHRTGSHKAPVKQSRAGERPNSRQRARFHLSAHHPAHQPRTPLSK
jgi:hypothetical protein